MAKTITPEGIRLTNRKQIYDYIYRNSRVSQNDILMDLRLSRPTVATNVAELEEDRLIFKDGLQDSSQIGRKASVYSVVSDYRVAIGVELTMHHAKIMAVDLLGNKIDRKIHDIQYVNSDEYYRTVCGHILDFADSLELTQEQILGVGISMQALVSPDGNSILYGKIMECTGVTIDALSAHLPYPCTFIHDPEGAALSELWASPELESAIYLSLSEHLGGALIVSRRVSRGKGGHSATFEHLTYDHDGKQCYCGRRGCFETVLSMISLLGDRDAEEFFKAARTPESAESGEWQSYLKVLAVLINNLHLTTDIDFILGGHLAPYFREEDIDVLYSEIDALCPFEEGHDFIRISKMPSHNINIGAALPFIESFLSSAGVAAVQ